MCGRYGRWSRRQRIEELLGIEPSGLDDFPPLYNITPGVNTWIARAKDGQPSLQSYLWGLVPYWSKDPKKGVRPINARSDTVAEKRMFRKLIRERRCLIPGHAGGVLLRYVLLRVQLAAAREAEARECDTEEREGGGLRYARAADRDADQKVVFVVGPRATIIE